MSVTTSLACHDCKSIIWIGQGDYIYTGVPACMDALKAWLYAHMGHRLEFVNEHNVAVDEYRRVAYGTWQPNDDVSE